MKLRRRGCIFATTQLQQKNLPIQTIGTVFVCGINSYLASMFLHIIYYIKEQVSY